jgi:hypothetical protein
MTASDRPKSATDPRRPYHVGVAVGLTTGVYAMSLLATTSMQIEQDRAVIADRDPVQAAIEALGQHHDEMEVHLLQARLRYQQGTEGYVTLADRLAALEARLSATDKSVSAAEQLGASLPSDLSVPGVSRTTRGGGSAGGGSSNGGGSSKVKLPPPPAAAPPPTSGSTGASGAP